MKKELYTYTLYTGAEIQKYIEDNPSSLLAQEFIRRYYTDIASGGWWLEPSFKEDKRYYIMSYTGMAGQTYSIHRETCYYDYGERYKKIII